MVILLYLFRSSQNASTTGFFECDPHKEFLHTYWQYVYESSLPQNITRSVHDQVAYSSAYVPIFDISSKKLHTNIYIHAHAFQAFLPGLVSQNKSCDKFTSQCGNLKPREK